MRALAALGFRFDSSFNGAWRDHGCDISLDPGDLGIREHEGIHEVPVSGLMDRVGHFRPAQLCAMSEEEMRDALDHSAASGAIQFSAFSHSFELLSRDRAVPNGLAIARMEALCRAVVGDPRVTVRRLCDAPGPAASAPHPRRGTQAAPHLAPHDRARRRLCRP
ncbi:hypothetical protein [Sphingopyxis sp. PET50]|uniref:hypothetical protein n=1 Tax=Sphingopyxis sp. PET50 TaxID=2976533 RepID=UPI0021AFA309|nr:hypothetical protein [Sphingopyxis sp. PET50]